MKPDPKAHESRMAELRNRVVICGDMMTGEAVCGSADLEEALAYADQLHEWLEAERANVEHLERSNDKYAEDLRLNLGALWRSLRAREAAERVVEACLIGPSYAIDAPQLCPLCPGFIGRQDRKEDGRPHDADCPLVANGFVTVEGERKGSLATTGGGREGGDGG